MDAQPDPVNGVLVFVGGEILVDQEDVRKERAQGEGGVGFQISLTL